jgi:glycosyltransferase involved in cell wall biosynthesis
MPGDLDTSGAMIRREEREWELADRIICGSQFVVDCIREIDGPLEKCRVVPYPTASIHHASSSNPTKNGRFRVLFVGTLQLRKGVHYLFESMRHLPTERFEVRMVGPNLLTEAATARLHEAGIEVVGSVPRDAVNQEYANADLFVLPTLSEGSANVCHEAIAAGLPVITTPAAGIAAHPQVTIVPTMDAVALANTIQMIATQGRPRLEQRQSQPRTVKQYGRELLEAIRDSR